MTMTAAVITEKNKRSAVLLAALVAGMLGLAYASVPLYDLFCRITGFGGTTQRATEAAPGAGAGRADALLATRSVRFNAHVTPGLEWRITPPPVAAHLRPGEEIRVIYKAHNPGTEPVTGTSSFNVTPNKIGPYFMKIECFCFTEQTLAPGETAEMPVVFYLDPDMDEDANTAATPEITLSYTFFGVKQDS